MIRRIEERDEEAFFFLMNEFYHSDAVLAPLPEEKIHAVFRDVLRENPYLDGYMMEEDGSPVGYCLLAKGYSTEAGGKILWIEDLYIRGAYRNRGLGSEMFAYIFAHYQDYKRYRLEVEEENTAAVGFYRRQGFDFLPYRQMIRDF